MGAEGHSFDFVFNHQCRGVVRAVGVTTQRRRSFSMVIWNQDPVVSTLDCNIQHSFLLTSPFLFSSAESISVHQCGSKTPEQRLSVKAPW